MSETDLGGDPPCWAHLIEDDDDEPSTDQAGSLVADLGAPLLGSGGAIWSLPHGGDLDANLVHLDPGGEIGAHANNDVDVLVFVRSGSGELMIGGQAHRLGIDHLVLIPKGPQRAIVAGTAGISYLSVHRRRSPLRIGRRDGAVNQE